MAERTRKKLHLKISSKADKQWECILRFFADRNRSVEYSRKLDVMLNSRLDMLCENPELGQETKRKRTRRHTFENYAVFYRVNGDTLEVTALVDARQDRKLD